MQAKYLDEILKQFIPTLHAQLKQCTDAGWWYTNCMEVPGRGRVCACSRCHNPYIQAIPQTSIQSPPQTTSHCGGLRASIISPPPTYRTPGPAVIYVLCVPPFEFVCCVFM